MEPNQVPVTPPPETAPVQSTVDQEAAQFAVTLQKVTPPLHKRPYFWFTAGLLGAVLLTNVSKGK